SYLDRSLTAKKTYFGFAARAGAKFALNDIEGAFADAKASFDIQPNIGALTILGDYFYAKTKSYDQAKDFWIGAYHLGDRDDRLIERLKKAGVPIPPPN